MIDVVQQINAVRRRVGTRALEAGEARTVIISQIYDAAVEDVWDACTSAERIPRWFLPVSGDLSSAAATSSRATRAARSSAVTRRTASSLTWEFGGQVSWVEVRLTAEAAERTRLEIEHIAHVSDERWAEFGPARSASAGTPRSWA